MQSNGNQIYRVGSQLFSEIISAGRKLFIIFAVGFFVGFGITRQILWPLFNRVMRAEMSTAVTNEVELLAQSPFEVVLIQGKVGAIFGVVATLPFIYIILRRKVLNYDGLDMSKVPTSVLGTGVIVGILLFIAGLVYSYEVFFPFIFSFLAEITIETSIAPTYSITEWTEFIIILSLSFGFVSQIPVFLPILVKYEVISYSLVRSKWRHWVFSVAVLGAVLSPPEPVSQVLWAAPLVVLYFLSLGVSRIIASEEQIQAYKDSKKMPKKGSNEQKTTDSKKETNQSQNRSPIISEPVENEIGGYYYTIQPYLKAMKSTAKVAGVVYAATMVLTFFGLFSGGLKWSFERLRMMFESPETLNIISLHPVEILSFQVKLSAIIALIVTVPIWVYLSIPEYQKKKLSTVSRKRFIKLTVFFSIILTIGTIVGYLFAVPSIFEFLVNDAVNRGMIISYRINSFFWLVIYLSVSFGLLLSVYSSVILGYNYGISYSQIVTSWRKVVFGIFMVAVLITPNDAGTAILFSLPIVLTYLLGATTVSIVRNLLAKIIE